LRVSEAVASLRTAGRSEAGANPGARAERFQVASVKVVYEAERVILA
jgi:hypothetical protein